MGAHFYWLSTRRDPIFLLVKPSSSVNQEGERAVFAIVVVVVVDADVVTFTCRIGPKSIGWKVISE